LKKQSQFVAIQVDAKSFANKDYDKIPGGGDGENKAKQSQFHAPEPPEGAREIEKSLAAADSSAG